ncbi:hypothetical protein [Clostridium rectalis]|nr:hypothetical protein [Clostridium rectalis]
MYTVEDIMDKLIDIEIQMNVLYSELSENTIRINKGRTKACS